MPKIFISYKHGHAASATLLLRLRDALEGAGFEVAADLHIALGSDWRSSLYDGLRDCAGAVLLVSRQTLSSEWCQREWEVLKARHVWERVVVVPLLLDDVRGNELGVFEHLHGLLVDRQEVAIQETLNALTAAKLWSTSRWRQRVSRSALMIGSGWILAEVFRLVRASAVPVSVGVGVTGLLALVLQLVTAPGEQEPPPAEQSLIPEVVPEVMPDSRTELTHQRAGLEERPASAGVAVPELVAGMEWVTPAGPLVWVPGGSFQMGSPESDEEAESDERPQHWVRVEGVWVMKYEATQELYLRVMGRNPVESCSAYKGVSFVDPSYPVMCVSWEDAVAFANALSQVEELTPAYRKRWESWERVPGANGYRLLTEAEWEHAARGGATGARYAGAARVAELCAVGNVADASARRFKWSSWEHAECDDGAAGLARVGAYRANGYGLHDMTGNVWEWVEDRYDSDFYASSSEQSPSGPKSGTSRVLRGGSWNNAPRNARVAVRNGYAPSDRYHALGVRLARPAP